MPLSTAMTDSTPQGGATDENHADQHVLITGRLNSHGTRISDIEDAIPAGGGADNVLMRIGDSGGSWLDGGKIGWRSIKQVTSPTAEDGTKKRILTATGLGTYAWRPAPVGDRTLPTSDDDTEGKWLKSVDGHASWETLEALPGGASIGEFLWQSGTGVAWTTVRQVPGYGSATDGQVVTLVAGVPAWADATGGSGLPSGGTIGQFLWESGTGPAWTTISQVPAGTNAGETIYFDGTDWQAGHKITTSTSAPSGTPADGDVWRVREA